MDPITTWTEGYLAVRRRAVDVRGLAQTHDAGGDVAQWPLTTGADAIELAALFDQGVRAYASPGLQRSWSARLDELARGAVHEPNRVYPFNRALWRTLESLAVFFDSVTAPPPRDGMWQALVSRIGAADELRNTGPTADGPFAHFEGIKTYDDLWRAQAAYLVKKRGADRLAPPPGFGGATMDVPRTTNADVLQLATYWTNALASAPKVMGYDGVKAKWEVALADVNRLAKPGNPGDVYPMNNAFWRRALEVAIQVAIGDEAPSKWDLFVGSVKDSITHLPETLEGAAETGVEVVEDTAHAAGKVVAAAGKGLFSGIGTPVLVGAGVLGAYLLLRDRHHEEG